MKKIMLPCYIEISEHDEFTIREVTAAIKQLGASISSCGQGGTFQISVSGHRVTQKQVKEAVVGLGVIR